MSASLSGDAHDRRRLVEGQAGLNGIDYVEVDASSLAAQHHVWLHLLKPGDAALVAQLRANPRAFTLTVAAGAGRGPAPRVVRVDGGVDGAPLDLVLDRPGGFAPHTLAVAWPGVDRFFGSVTFDFKATCPARFDCRPEARPPPARPPPPHIDYETRDYAGFRSLMLDRLRTLMPDWEGHSEADVTVTLVEQMAWAADRLSYMQDVVGTEAFLDAARLRTSVRRHARLVDHVLAEGTSAQAAVHFEVEGANGEAVRVPKGTAVYARIPDDPAMEPFGHVVPATRLAEAARRAGIVYETSADAVLHQACSRIALHHWGLDPCVLEAGATHADLVGDLHGVLAPGALLVLQEAKDPRTGLAEDADPRHRFLVRLTRVDPPVVDPVGKVTEDPYSVGPLAVTRVHWDALDAPGCDLPIRGLDATGVAYEEATVALGNVVLADHGLTRVALLPGPVAPPHAEQRRAFRLELPEAPLTHAAGDAAGPAALLRRHAERKARPAVAADLLATSGGGSGYVEARWEPGDLLEHGADEQAFAVEVEEDRAYLRFGDGHLGRAPPDGRPLRVTYRVGNGPGGHVGHGGLAHVAEAGADAASLLAGRVKAVTNPLASWGGLAPEELDAARRDAPEAFRSDPRRAVTEKDYAAAALRVPGVQGAQARFRWTGSWHTVFLYVDPLGRADLDAGLKARVRDTVKGFTQAGYDLEVRGPHPVPLELEVQVCALPDHLAADVERAVRSALGSGVLPDGRKAFFHPDRFTFGQGLHLSSVVAAVEAVDGVDSVRVASLRRALGGPGPVDGKLEAGPLEILRLDGDRDHPDNGRLEVHVHGGAA